MLGKNKILTKLKQHSDRIEVYGVKRLGLFGSFVRKKQDTGSDIDILVEFKRGRKTFDNYMGLKFFLEELFHKKVDLVIKSALKARIKHHVLAGVKYA